MSANKTVCPITREQFRQHAQPLSANVNGTPMSIGVKEFSPGSFGWFDAGKVVVDIDGVPTKVQLQVQAVVIGSKELGE